jgi:hypothetical protein
MRLKPFEGKCSFATANISQQIKPRTANLTHAKVMVLP